MTGGHVERFGRLRRELHEARAEGRRRWGDAFADLGGSEPLTAWPSDAEADRALAVAAHTRRYGPVEGRDDIRAAVAAHYGRALGIPLGPEHVLLSPGALAGITLAVLALCRPGEPVAVPLPHYHAYPGLIELAGGRPVPVPVDGRLTIRPPGALLLANPVNPTGAVYGRRHLERILPGGPVVADEVYAEHVYDPRDFTSVASMLPLDGSVAWLAVRSASKTLGRPGLRVGVVIGPAPLIAAVADRSAVLSGAANLPGQLAFAAGLPGAAAADHMRPYRARLHDTLALCEGLGLPVERPRGTYYLWVGPPAPATAAHAARLCRDAGVFVWPGEYFGSPSHARVSLAVPRATLAAGLRRLAGAR
ncbi:pyridoxal phosphate-dependent aminotransferase [Dactylosporangium salmoneum]|uniref:Pyridoxal phosphate-dependent aminotransferase n=1 Tax=Dactylosporangium salmoneum TaxID=53361 RepID=A0ABP5SW38_9ACTN